MLKKIRVKADTVGLFIAQANSLFTSSTWYESNEPRCYIINFADYCVGRTGIFEQGVDKEIFINTRLYLEGIAKGTVDTNDLQRFLNETDKAFSYFMRDVGLLYLKTAVLLKNTDLDYAKFDIMPTIPKVVKSVIPQSEVPSVLSCSRDRYYIIKSLPAFDTIINSVDVIDIFSDKCEFSIKDVLDTKGTDMEDLALKGFSYLYLAENNIKGYLEVKSHG